MHTYAHKHTHTDGTSADIGDNSQAARTNKKMKKGMQIKKAHTDKVVFFQYRRSSQILCVCVCVYMCVCVCMLVCMHVCVHACACACAWACACAYTCVCACTCARVCACAYACLSDCPHVSELGTQISLDVQPGLRVPRLSLSLTHTQMLTHTRTHIQTHTRLWMFDMNYEHHTSLSHTHTCTHTHLQTLTQLWMFNMG